MTSLATERLDLCPIRREDTEYIWPYVSDPEISRHMSWEPHASLEVTEAFISDMLRRMEDGSSITWVIRERFTGDACGLVSLIAIVRTHRALRYDKAELAYWIGRPFQNKGYATEACRAVIDYAFGPLALNKIAVAHDAENTASEALIRRLGFRRIGIEYKHFCKNGRWIDHVVYEMLNRQA